MIDKLIRYPKSPGPLRTCLLLFFLLFFITLTHAQEFTGQREPVTFESVIDRLIHSAPQTIRVRNKTIDFGLFSLRKIGRVFPDAKIDSGKLILDKNLVFENCRLTGKGISNLDITNIAFINCEIASMTLSSINASSLEVSECELQGLRLIR